MQKVLIVPAVCCLLMIGASGCSKPEQTSNGVKIEIVGGGRFPAELAGTWKADDGGWEFVFDANGTFSSAIVSMGRVRVVPGETTKVPLQKGGEAIFEPGEWTAGYNPATRELTVEITLKRFYAEFGGGTVEGKSTDVFGGTVSKDGKTASVEWTRFLTATAHLPERPDFDMSDDPVYGEIKKLTFTKVKPQKKNSTTDKSTGGR